MFAPLSEHIEIKLDEAFCKEFRVYGTYDRPTEWEEYKKAFAEFLINEFKGNRPKQTPWDGDIY
jgi:hypothetical protein